MPNTIFSLINVCFRFYGTRTTAGDFLLMRSHFAGRLFEVWLLLILQTAVYHGLRGSPVLTASGFVNGRWQFSTPAPQNPHPLTDHQKIWYMCLCWQAIRLCQISCKSVDGGFWANAWNIATFYAFFHQLTYRSDPPTDFHAWWLKRRGLAQGCAFWGFRWRCSPLWEWNPPKTPISPQRYTDLYKIWYADAKCVP